RSPYSTPLPPHSFSFSSCVDHRDLHSFPTRRSSDLLAKSAPNSFDRRVPVTGPGQMAFTRTPFWAASAAVERVRPSIPALAAAYAEPHKYAALAERLEIFRIMPEPRAYISGNTSFDSKNAARRCTAITLSNSASGYSSTGTTGP